MDFSQFNGYFVVHKSSHCPVLSLMEKVMLTWLMLTLAKMPSQKLTLLNVEVGFEESTCDL